MARVLQHDCRSLTPGGLLLGALSLRDKQDCIIGGSHHGGALALSREGAEKVLALSPKFEFLRSAKDIFWIATQPAGYLPYTVLLCSTKLHSFCHFCCSTKLRSNLILSF